MAVNKIKISLANETNLDEFKRIIIEQAGVIKEINKELKTLRKKVLKLETENKDLREKLNLSPFSPSCPSGAKPGFVKPETKKHSSKRKKSSTHKRVTRTKPDESEITNHKDETLESCPDCGNQFEQNSSSNRNRIIIDIELPSKPVTTEHTIHQYWCTNCLKMKEKIITDAFPKFSIGIKTMIFTAYQHYYNGMSISKIRKELSIQGLKVNEGTLINGWNYLAELMNPFHTQLEEMIRNTNGAVFADESSWRQKGKKFWIWSFSTTNTALFKIKDNRSGRVVIEVFGKVFSGILVTDFWKPYLAVDARLRQWCVAHFLREFRKIEFKRENPPLEYYQFKKKVKRLFRDALRFSKLKTTKQKRLFAQKRFLKRLDLIAKEKYNDKDIQRLVKRLKTYRNGFFTFVVEEGVDPTNNYAERTIRFAVIMRKTSFHTMSDRGSETMSILMSVFKTLELRGHEPYHEVLKMAKNEIIKRKLSKSNLAA